jgi:hypothetical protein
MASGGVDKMEVKSSSADGTFDAFSSASFPPLGDSDALVDRSFVSEARANGSCVQFSRSC